MKTKYKYIEMEEIENKKGKTKIYSIKNKLSIWEIGKIKWFHKWRQYCFYPETNTIFPRGCLDDIADLIYNLMEERKK